MTLKEIAAYLEIPEASIVKLIQQKKIRAVHDGKQFLVNKDQFSTHLEQVEKMKKLAEEYLSEPMPEDWDVKDED